jgi:hypothetical protein
MQMQSNRRSDGNLHRDADFNQISTTKGQKKRPQAIPIGTNGGEKPRSRVKENNPFATHKIVPLEEFAVGFADVDGHLNQFVDQAFDPFGEDSDEL